MTGLYNYAYFKHFLELEIKRATRQKNSIVLIMIDVDNFKSINDTYGHPAGDNVLRTLGNVIRGNVREVDLPVRYGGEEFALVMPYAGKTDAGTVAEKLLHAIRSTEIRPDESSVSPVSITVSMGISVYPSDGKNIDELIRTADSALYQAKKNGKNRICMFNSRKTEWSI